MKKLFSLFLVAGVYIHAAYSQNTIIKNDLTDLNLLGKVKSMTQARYTAIDKFGLIQKGEFEFKDKTFFNENGNKIEVNEYNLDSSLKHKNVCKYNITGKIIEENSYKANGSLSQKFIYKYDDKGNKIEYCSYNSDGSIFQKLIYKYDINGNMVEENNCVSGNSSLCQKSIIKYDVNGNMIEQELYWRDTLDWKDNYVNDDNGNMIKSFRYYPVEGVIDSCIYKYNSTKNIVSEKDYLSDGTLFQNFIYLYDDKGNEIEMDFCDSIGVVTRKDITKYDYDRTGNWIKKTEYQNYFPYLITEREIEYY